MNIGLQILVPSKVCDTVTGKRLSVIALALLLVAGVSTKGGDMLVTMAIAVIGGLLYSLLLTLLFLPAAYGLAYHRS